MTTVSNKLKFKLSRKGRKLQFSDEPRILLVLPKEVPERMWADILLKEENELLCLDIREEILDEALRIGYLHFFEKQTVTFTTYCVQKAFFKLINWHFYRHDPGEDRTAHPPSYIPYREESWTPDPLPAASPKDTWGRRTLEVLEDTSPELMPTWSCSDSPVLDEIPKEYWFPGKVNIGGEVEEEESITSNERPLLKSVSTTLRKGIHTVRSYSYLSSESEPVGNASEELQKVTDYTTALVSEPQGELPISVSVKTKSQLGLLHGAGDSSVKMLRSKRSPLHQPRWSLKSTDRQSDFRVKSKMLPPIDTPSHHSTISDCRLRALRVDAQYQIASEKINTPPPARSNRR